MENNTKPFIIESDVNNTLEIYKNYVSVLNKRHFSDLTNDFYYSRIDTEKILKGESTIEDVLMEIMNHKAIWKKDYYKQLYDETKILITKLKINILLKELKGFDELNQI
jgi:uncharacterized protein YpbB